jgi:hypothetical protein
VVLLWNISDSLVNGSRGVVIGYETVHTSSHNDSWLPDA